MKLNWITNHGANPFGATVSDNIEHTVHYSVFNGDADHEAQQAIDACIEKACTLLDTNIKDNSRYLLFRWDVSDSTLTISVTDDEKEKDSPNVVQCQFSANDKKFNPDDIQYWIKDYLTTCAPFLRYSLIAAFYRESRTSCTLL